MGCVQSQIESKESLNVDPKAENIAEDGESRKNSGCMDSTSGKVSEVMESRSLSGVKSCEKIGVSSKQMFNLRQSWKGIKRNMEDTGVEMFVRLFKSNESLKELFHGFRDLKSDDELRSNEAVENHATLVMTTLDDAITHIDNFDYVSELLRKTGASHVRFDGFTTDNFYNIREPFLQAVKITLGDRYTENMESIYKLAITFILQTMSEGMEDALKDKIAAAST